MPYKQQFVILGQKAKVPNNLPTVSCFTKWFTSLKNECQ